MNHQSSFFGDPLQFGKGFVPQLQDKVFAIIISAYRELETSCKVTSEWEEDQITSELFDYIQIIWKNDISDAASAFLPKHQGPIYPKPNKKGRAPTIDIVFTTHYGERTYFGFECKLVERGNSSQLTNYVTEGMKRYIEEKYSKDSNKGAMIAYTFEENVDLLIEAINSKISKIGGLAESDFITNGVTPLSEFNAIYFSHHRRKSRGAFDIFHLIFRFGC